ncbi:TetR family transcriptional regulator [Actinokineospora auranticolor]|uniref:AcrR family transcriptional regulator n=1 Tax=Actinokineospora auranticolor TaxID=155976 RepID=A0A2S6GT01_9PSEU|nr:TetR family transcriptional regulator [Actinokineospora auranticolor]PPK68307.1 AcrR family transcriptional regulator [Actinokineospora auranticolor]
MGLRESKKQRTREALSWAAIRLAVERGFDNVLVEDIAAAAGVSPRTFNNYFSSKAEAIATRHLDRGRRIAAELRARPADEPLWPAVAESVAAAFLAMAGEDDTSDHWQAGVRAMLEHPALQGEVLRVNARADAELAEVIAERTGTDPAGMYPRLVAGAVGATILVATDHWRRATPSVPFETVLREALRHLANGLSTP